MAVAMTLVLGACSEEDDPAAQPSTTTQVTPPKTTPASPSPPCAGEIASGDRLPGTLEGDVDGDGRVDEIYLVRSDAANAECRTLLVVRAAGTTYAISTEDPDMPSSLPQPRLNRLAHVDDEGGAEVLVDVEAGAATQFVAMFTIDGGDLVRVRLAGDAGLGDLFPYGGSVGHIEASNCPVDDSSDVVIALATPRGSRYLVERTYYDLDDGTLVEVARDEERLEVAALSREHDYVTSPFGSCLVNP